MSTSQPTPIVQSEQVPPTVQQVMGPSALSTMKGALGDLNFDGRNYFAWKTKMDVLLRNFGLGEFVKGSVEDPVKDQFVADLVTMTFSSSLINAYRNFLCYDLSD